MSALEQLAFVAATAYAECPGTNKNDPRAFGEAVRNVYESVLAVKVATSVWRPGVNGLWFKSTNGGPFLRDPEYGENT